MKRYLLTLAALFLGLGLLVISGCDNGSELVGSESAEDNFVVPNAIDGDVPSKAGNVASTPSKAQSSESKAMISESVAATCQDVLIYDQNAYYSHARNAVAGLGLPFTHAVSSDFNTLITGRTWDLVIMDMPSLEPNDGWQANLVNHINAGGLAIHTHWNSFSLTAALQAAFEISDPVAHGTQTFYRWDGHPLFSTPNSVPTVFDVWADLWSINGFDVAPTGRAVAAAGTTPSPADSRATIVIGNDGRTIFNGLLFDDYQPADKNANGQKDIEELIQNEVEALCSPAQSNQSPTGHAGGPYTGTEGIALTFDGSGSSDADDDPLTYEWDFDYDGQAFDVDGTGAAPSHTYPDDGTFTVALRVDDGTVASEIATTTAEIANAAPSVDAITGAPLDPVPVGTEVSISADFSDAGTADTHTGPIDWNAGGTAITTSGTVSETDGSGSVSGSYTYTEPGVYTIEATVTDDDGDSGSSVYEYVVVYDPSAGFVVGSGWIDSPLGAYADDPSLTGKASFGFVSRYKKGANTPSGHTQFKFKAGDLNFHSTAYDWLVVAGAKGKFKGSGTINGSGDYGFMLTATDSKVNGGGPEDLFRIKIWLKDTDEVVYDNQMGEDDDSDAGTALGGGNIAIHSK